MTEQQAGPGTRVLRRSRSDRVVGGVCGGLGRYFAVDPVLVRIVAVALALTGGAGLLAYVIAWAVLPEDEEEGEAPAAPQYAASSTVTVVLGAALVGLGALLLVRQFLPWFGLGVLWPSLLVLAGVLVILGARGQR